jgi:hypothetical protein
MTASATLRDSVTSAIHGNGKGSLRFLTNLKGAYDALETTSIGGKSTKLFFDTRTLGASATENLDLAAGNLVATDGSTLTFTKIHAIYLKADVGNTNAVLAGGAASNGMSGPFNDVTDIIKLNAGEVWHQTSIAGWTVVAATGDLLKILNGGAGTPVTYDIVIMGE